MARDSDKDTQSEISKSGDLPDGDDPLQHEGQEESALNEVAGDMDHMERISAVCELFTKGKTVKEIT
ncbi:MAG: hypothetical protein KAT30_02375, partial [Candidatus Krumholzibacteria bacterium]|nr:hypothetical protein [Candidatus Krumholzibacteria bacterium]